jgi:hypothetical protein
MIGLQNKEIWQLVLLMSISLLLHIWGIQRDLPYSEELDETFFVEPAIRMNAEGSLNPKWFGHPGSTVIYPLAAIFHFRNFLFHQGTLRWPDPNIAADFDQSSPQYYLIGRYLSVAYAVLALPLLFVLGRQTYGTNEALIACTIFMLLPLSLSHSQMIRTDSPAVFFGLLSLCLCARLHSNSSRENQILTGGAIGLAVASRYFMVALIPVFLAANIFRKANGEDRRFEWPLIAAGLMAIGVSFFLSTPFILLDYATALDNIIGNARSTFPGADGFSKPGNFAWYWSHSIPRALTLPVFAALLIGVGQLLWDRRVLSLFLGLFVLVFVTGLSLSSLHWDRWIIPILPVLALLAAAGVVKSAHMIKQKAGWSILWFLVVLSAAQLAYKVSIQNQRQHNPSTQVLARDWIVANVPSGSIIFQEWYAAHLRDAPYFVATAFSMSQVGDLEYFQNENADFLVVSDYIYSRFFREPKRYPNEVRYYQELFKKGRLEKSIRPSLTTGGPEIRIYRISPIDGHPED